MTEAHISVIGVCILRSLKFILTFYITNSIKQNPSLKATSNSAGQEINHLLWNTKFCCCVCKIHLWNLFSASWIQFSLSHLTSLIFILIQWHFQAAQSWCEFMHYGPNHSNPQSSCCFNSHSSTWLVQNAVTHSISYVLCWSTTSQTDNGTCDCVQYVYEKWFCKKSKETTTYRMSQFHIKK